MNNKIIKMLIPIIAVVVIFESVVLVSNLEKNTTVTVVSDVTPTITVTEEKKVNAFDVNFSTDETQMKVGKKYKVSVKLTPKDNQILNALDLYVKFDPKMVTVSNLVSSKDLVNPDLIKVSDKKDVMMMNYLFTDKEGVAFTKDKEVVLLTFTVTPKVAGNSSFEISTGDSEGDSVTMFVDKNTSEGLFFTSNKLEVELIN
ncbi:MAG: hypothetical protein PHP97_03750 [Candidatus Shapirobacteria bacterium]|nr:hypothetical protein [Candidatus Shapirobacteria bacterium]MDD3002250.1 hypothetical protein [Candidatus Shapirobacteria bacterium]MDD4383537.1 hypothetical protein [Candidatus Shapirobacteria bacterium]